MNKYVNLFIDKQDYEKKLTADNIINIIGTKGSGKTTSSLKYINDKDYIVINCDRLLDLPEKNTIANSNINELKDYLKNNCVKTKDDESFTDCYFTIINYIKKQNKKAIIEGNIIQNIKPITRLKGTIIIKRTGVIKCFIRAIKRDYPNQYFLDLEIKKHGKLGRLYRLKNIISRRKSIFSQSKIINEIIKELDNTN